MHLLLRVVDKMSRTTTSHVMLVIFLALLMISPITSIGATQHSDQTPNQVDDGIPMGSCGGSDVAIPESRADHVTTVDVPVSLIYSAQMCPYTWGGLMLNMSHYDAPVYAGTDWKGAFHANPERIEYPGSYQGKEWWPSRSYLKTPMEIVDGAKVTDAQLKLRTIHSTDYDVPLYGYQVTQYWDKLFFGDPPDYRLTIEYFPKTQLNNGTSPISKPNANVDVSLDVTGVVNEWFEGKPNYGICIRGKEMQVALVGDEAEADYFGTCFFQGLGSPHPPILTVTYAENQAPEAKITSDYHPPFKAGTPVTFQGLGTDPDGDNIATYEWSSDRDGVLSSGPDKSSFTTSDLSAGVHKISLRVMDDFMDYPKWSPTDLQYVKVLENTPDIVAVEAFGPGDSSPGYEFQTGLPITINVDVEGGSDPITGWVNISYWLNDTPVVSMGKLNSLWSYTWTTQGYLPDMYQVHVEVTDGMGYRDSEGLYGMEPELIIVLVDQKPPSIGDFWVENDAGERDLTFNLGEALKINILEGGGERGLAGSVRIYDPQGVPTVFNNPVSEGEESGLYSVWWYTRDLTTGGGTYTLRAIMEDIGGNKATDDIQVTLIDMEAPSLATVKAFSGSQQAVSFPVATAITIVVEEDSLREGLKGELEIKYDDEYILFSEPMTEMGDGKYYFTWQTADMLAGWYSINATLLDDDGDIDPDGLGLMDSSGKRLPDLRIRLTLPPAGLVVLHTLPIPGSRDFPPEGNVYIQFSKPVDSRTVSASTISFQGPDGYQVAGQWAVSPNGILCSFDPDGSLQTSSLYTLDVTENVLTDEGGEATSFNMIFETGEMPASVGMGLHPQPDGLVQAMNFGDNRTFRVTSEIGADIVVEWYLNGRRIENATGPEYTLFAVDDAAGTNTLEALVISGDLDETVTWTVYVLGKTSGEDAGSGNDEIEGQGDGQGDVTGADGSGDEGTDWLLIAGAVVFVMSLVFLLVSFLFFHRKGGSFSGDDAKENGERGKDVKGNRSGDRGVRP